MLMGWTDLSISAAPPHNPLSIKLYLHIQALWLGSISISSGTEDSTHQVGQVFSIQVFGFDIFDLHFSLALVSFSNTETNTGGGF